MSWSAISARIVAKIMDENPQDDAKALKKKISAAYPFGKVKKQPPDLTAGEFNRRE